MTETDVAMTSKAETRELTADDIEALAKGAWILGTGGGGDPYHKLLNLRLLYRAGKSVQLLDPLSLPDDAMVAVVSTMGAPIVGQERLTDPALSVRPVRLMEKFLGRNFDAVMALEIGGGNGLQAPLVAALTGLPVIDADAMGRAYPEAQMTSFAVAQLCCYPFAMADIRDNELLIPVAASWHWLERISRKVCSEFGATAATCKAPRSGADIKRFAILNTTSQAIQLGEALINAAKNHSDPIAAIVSATGGIHLYSGKVVNVQRNTTEGFLRGSVTIEPFDSSVPPVVIHFQNEFTLVTSADQAVVMTPDLICVLDSVSGVGIGTETIRYGQRVAVLALPAPAVFTCHEGLAAVGPRAFGFDLDYQSVFSGVAS